MEVVAGARARAAELGDPRRAPPTPLEECERGTIESALATPRMGWGPIEKYRSVEAKAAVLMYALAKSQACIDGNKRVALLLVVAFLRLNGYRLETAPGELADLILGIAQSDSAVRNQTTRDATMWLRSRLVRLNEEEN